MVRGKKHKPTHLKKYKVQSYRKTANKLAEDILVQLNAKQDLEYEY